MGSRLPFVTIDDERLVRVVQRHGGILGSPCDVETSDAEVRILHVEVVCVTYGTVFEDRNGYVACGRN